MKERVERDAAIGIEQLASEDETCEGIRSLWVLGFYHVVSRCAESCNGCFQGTLDCRGRGHNIYFVSITIISMREGMGLPSEYKTPIRSFLLSACLCSSSLQRNGCTVWSYFHGSMEINARVKYVKSSSVRAIGLKTLGTPSCPGILVLTPDFIQRPVLQRRE